jgi:DNA-binding transcriptional LysR family regulator
MINDGEVGVLKIAVSSSVELGLIMSFVSELKKHLSDLELKILRGPGIQVAELLKSGDAELAVAAAIGDAWDRLDRWPLFEESFDLAFSRAHRLASQEAIAIADLKVERFLLRSHCESSAEVTELLQGHGLNADRRHEVSSDQDLIALLEANIGIGFVPRSVSAPPSLVRTTIDGLDLRRQVFLYGVAGRQRTPVAATFMKMLRAANWPGSKA